MKAAETSQDADRRPIRVLVIEDEASIRERVMRTLDLEGYDARGAADGEAGLLEAARFGPDLVITDLLMPKIDGLEVVARLRGDAELNEAPIVILSAFSDEPTRQLAAELGADAYLVKPLSLAALLATLEGLLRDRGLWRVAS